MHERVCEIRRNRATIVPLPAAFGSGQYSESQLNKFWQECSLGSAYSPGLGEQRVIVLSAELFPPVLAKVSNTRGFDMTFSDYPKATPELAKVLKWIASQRKDTDVVVFFR